MSEDALPPLGRVLMTHVGCAVFEAVTGEVVEPSVAIRFYPGIATGAGTPVWATRRRPTHEELVRAWPAREEPGPAETERGWWEPTIVTLREERRRTASLSRAQATRQAG